MKEKEVEVLLVQPEKYPKKVSISRGLESLQKEVVTKVGGYLMISQIESEN